MRVYPFSDRPISLSLSSMHFSCYIALSTDVHGTREKISTKIQGSNSWRVCGESLMSHPFPVRSWQGTIRAENRDLWLHILKYLCQNTTINSVAWIHDQTTRTTLNSVKFVIVRPVWFWHPADSNQALTWAHQWPATIYACSMQVNQEICLR